MSFSRKIFYSTTDAKRMISHRVIVNAAIKFEQKHIRTPLRLYTHRSSIDAGTIIRGATLIFGALARGIFCGPSAIGIQYKEITIGRYAVSSALRHPRAYLSKYVYYRGLIRSVLECVRNVDNFMCVRGDVAACYVNEPHYTNGVYCELASKFGIPFYHNSYPYRLTRFMPSPGTKAVSAFSVRPHHAPDRLERGRQILEGIVASTEKIGYMATVPFESRTFDSTDVEVVIYAHSFTDAQQSNGGDPAFLNMYDWLSFSLETLKENKVLLKAHPGFFRKGYAAQVIEWDRLVFEEIVKRFSGRPNLTIVDWPMRNVDLLNRLDKDCVLVSHHGNALLEGAQLGFRCISSHAAPWREYALFNIWTKRSEYRFLLEQHEMLERSNLKQLHAYVHDLYEGPHSFYSKDAWRHVAEQETGITAAEISRNSNVLNRLSETEIERLVDAVAEKVGTLELH
jgi:hypothetical protein